ncbi:MAG: hypothetical protein AAGA84_03800 [Pseudomonadota bacterium]
MRRAHRRWHRRLWLGVVSLIIMVMVVAIQQRKPEPVNVDLPASLIEAH